MFMYISRTRSNFLFLHPPAVAIVAGCQLGDIEAGTGDKTVRKTHTYIHTQN